MLAIVLPGAVDLAARPLLGAPFLQRQLEWLRANGVRKVGVARRAGDRTPPALSASALRVTGVDVVHIPVPIGLGPREILERFTRDGDPVVIVGHATLGDATLADAIALARTGRDAVVSSGHAGVAVLAPGDHGGAPFWDEPTMLAADGWIEDIETETKAQAIAAEILVGMKGGVEIAGSPDEDRVYRARGSVIDRDATVIGPSFIGKGALVAAGAVVGPFAVLDAGAVVESGATVRGARVAERTILGSGVTLIGGLADGDRLQRRSGIPVALGEPLIVARRGGRPLDPFSRLVAMVLFPLLAIAGFLGSLRARRAAFFARRAAAPGQEIASDEVALLEGALAIDDAPPEARAAARFLFDATERPRANVRLALASLYGGAAVAP